MTTIAKFSVSNWEDAELYQLDSIEKLPEPFVKSLREYALPDEEILYINRRWQFLRRHPAYQMWWTNRDGSAFGLQSPKCPSPAEAHPLGLVFCENSKGETYAFIEYQALLAKQNTLTLSPIEKFAQSLIHAAYPAMQWPHFEFPNSHSARKRKVSFAALSKLLKVIDALADNISTNRIERDLGNHVDKAGRRLKARARQAMVDCAKIPIQ